jgi:hypothetical protein
MAARSSSVKPAEPAAVRFGVFGVLSAFIRRPPIARWYSFRPLRTADQAELWQGFSASVASRCCRRPAREADQQSSSGFGSLKALHFRHKSDIVTKLQQRF